MGTGGVDNYPFAYWGRVSEVEFICAISESACTLAIGFNIFSR